MLESVAQIWEKCSEVEGTGDVEIEVEVDESRWSEKGDGGGEMRDSVDDHAGLKSCRTHTVPGPGRSWHSCGTHSSKHACPFASCPCHVQWCSMFYYKATDDNHPPLSRPPEPTHDSVCGTTFGFTAPTAISFSGCSTSCDRFARPAILST
jgi:hypothetical protein